MNNRMQNNTEFIVNIIPLQNVQSNVSGLDSISALANDVAAIKRLVNTDTNKILTNSLGSYTTGSAINVTSPLNLCNVAITGNAIGNSGILSNLTSVLTVYPTTGPLTTAMNIETASIPSALTVSENGSLAVNGSGTFGGICYATQFLTLSDVSGREWRSPVLSDLQSIHPYVFTNGSATNIGLIAQEVGSIWPQLINENYVNYDGMVAILLKAVQELGDRLRILEAKNQTT